MRHNRSRAGELLCEGFDPLLDEWGRLLDVGVLLVERRVAVAADQQTPVGELLPVVVSVAGAVWLDLAQLR